MSYVCVRKPLKNKSTSKCMLISTIILNFKESCISSNIHVFLQFFVCFFLLISVFLFHITANTFPWMNPNIQSLCFSAFEDNKILTWLDAIVSLWFLSHTVPEFSLSLFTLWKGSCELSFSSPWTTVLLEHTVKFEQCTSFEPLQTSSLCLIFSLILRICYYFLIYQTKLW